MSAARARRTSGRRHAGRPRVGGVLPARFAITLLTVLLITLQVRLWAGDGGVQELYRLSQEIDRQSGENLALRERNEALDAEVLDLKQGAAAIEERARSELSMIRHDETFFQAVER